MIDPDRKLKRTIDLTEQIRKDDQLRKQLLGNDQLLKDSELVRSVEKMRKLTEPMETLTASLKPMQDALRGGEEMGKLTKQLQDAIGGSSRLTDIIRSTTMPTVSPLNNHLEALDRARAEAAEAPTARRAVRRIEEQIREFEAELDNNSEIGIQLVTFGEKMVVHIETVDYFQPNLIVFIGHLDETGAPVRLVQHMSQLSFLLVRLPRLEPEKPRRPIGFTTSEEGVQEQ